MRDSEWRVSQVISKQTPTPQREYYRLLRREFIITRLTQKTAWPPSEAGEEIRRRPDRYIKRLRIPIALARTPISSASKVFYNLCLMKERNKFPPKVCFTRIHG